MCRDEYQTSVVAFIRSNGVTRCPTACALRTQGTIAAADRAALQHYAAVREWLPERRSAARRRLFRTFVVSVATAE